MPIQPPTKGAEINVHGLSRVYRMGESEIRAVNDVTFSIDADEFVALLGTSGSGKSSLLNLIAGLDTPPVDVLLPVAVSARPLAGSGEARIPSAAD